MKGEGVQKFGVLIIALAVCGGCQSSRPVAISKSVAEVWRVDRDLSAHPPVWFSFPKPFETYAGEFLRVDGELRVHDGAVEGWFRVRIMDVTLGEEELDKNVRHNMEMLAGGAYPTSTFTVRSITPWKSVAVRTTEVLLVGELELKGITVPIKAPAIMDFSKSGRLHLKGGFAVESLKERFAIVGPGVEGETEGDRVEVLFDVTLLRGSSDNDASRIRAYDKGTKRHSDEATEARRDEGTEAQRHEAVNQSVERERHDRACNEAPKRRRREGRSHVSREPVSCVCSVSRETRFAGQAGWKPWAGSRNWRRETSAFHTQV